jgi:hypothetical protein
VTWLSLWFVLVTLAAIFFALLGRRIFHQAKQLATDVSATFRRLADVSAAISQAASQLAPPPDPEPARSRRTSRRKG